MSIVYKLSFSLGRFYGLTFYCTSKTFWPIAQFIQCSIISPTFIDYKVTSSCWSVLFSLVFIGKSMVSIRVVNLPEWTKKGLITG